MSNSFSTSVSGLLAHQSMLNIAGNNLANVNTTAYKSQRMNFADTLYNMQRGASASTEGLGGRNPIEIGTGVGISSVDRNHNQGDFETTNQTYDLAIDGSGYFILDNGTQQALTRAGTFELDHRNQLVDKATGAFVQRTGSAGEATNLTDGFQIPGNDSIRVPIGASIAGVPSESIDIGGNLDSSSQGPSPKTIKGATPLLTAGEPATASTRINDLDGAAYAAGDVLFISGSAANGDAISTEMDVNDTSTLTDLLDSINQAYPSATATIDAGGSLIIAGDENGPSKLSIRLADANTNTGQGVFSAQPLVTTLAGSKGDVVPSSVEFFDLTGGLQILQVDLRKAEQGWSVEANIDSSIASLPPNPLGFVDFDSSGALQSVSGSAGATGIPLTITYPGSGAIQTMQLNFGKSESFDPLKQTANESGTFVESDGFSASTLVSANIEHDGMLIGEASNGRKIPIAQLALARVSNPNGLSAIGDNHFVSTRNSGQVEVGSAATAGRGMVLSGQLESSNVDLAYEFTRLIVAQRGFSANARGITVAKEIMDEVTNIIR